MKNATNVKIFSKYLCITSVIGNLSNNNIGSIFLHYVYKSKRVKCHVILFKKNRKFYLKNLALIFKNLLILNFF